MTFRAVGRFLKPEYKPPRSYPPWGPRRVGLHTEKPGTSFLLAGSNVIETATYQGSIQGFVKHLEVSKEEAIELMKKGANLAVEARDEFYEKHSFPGDYKPIVAASIGPYGAHLHDGSEYTGNYVDSLSSDELIDWHRPQVKSLLDSKVDLLAFDTIPAKKEAEAIVDLLKEFPAAKAWVSYSCSSSTTTSHGDVFAESLDKLANSDQVIGIGINCTPPEYIEKLLKAIPTRIKEKKVVIVYPNSGEEWTPEKTWLKKAECRGLHEYVSLWVEKGANWIGGCCRVSAKDIADIKKSLLDKQ